MSPLKVAYWYAHTDKDERLREKLQAHLGTLERSGQIVSWHDRMILPGEDREQEIERNLGDADSILLLISPDFISSGYHSCKEMRQARRRWESGITSVIPILIRPVEWKETPIGTLQALPLNGRPITLWHNQDEACQCVVQGVQRAVNSVVSRALIRSGFHTVFEALSSPPPCCPKCGSSFFLDFSDSRVIWCGLCESDVMWVVGNGRFVALSDDELIRASQRKLF